MWLVVKEVIIVRCAFRALTALKKREDSDVGIGKVNEVRHR